MSDAFARLRQRLSFFFHLDEMEVMLDNSFKDFHAKGTDYLCLRRQMDGVTTKVYFLNGDVTKLPEVVNPHDHRYDFQTTVLAGSMTDHRFKAVPRDKPGAKVYQRFKYMTPLNGGNGFTFECEQALQIVDSEKIGRLQTIHRRLDEVHTIQMREDQTVLLLRQERDELPLDVATTCWVARGEPKPDVSGLYTRFTADQLLDRLKIVTDLVERTKG